MHVPSFSPIPTQHVDEEKQKASLKKHDICTGPIKKARRKTPEIWPSKHGNLMAKKCEASLC